MSIVDLHPEELLDKHARGMLSESEAARLEAHVATCAVCRYELVTRSDFEREASSFLGPAPAAREVTEPPANVSVMVAPDGALAPMRHAPPRPRRRAWIVGLAAALIGGISFAALSARVLSMERTPPGSSTPTAQHPARASATPAMARLASDRAPADAVPALTVPAATAATPNVPPEATSESAPAGKAVREAANRNDLLRASHGTPTAPELFRAANAARREHDAERAIALYRELESRYPRSEEARVSYATLGSLLLDQGDPRAALDGFNRYLSRGETALGEEALVGRALAFRRLGSRDGEVAAWQEVLRRFPGSIHAELARTRLADLGAR